MKASDLKLLPLLPLIIFSSCKGQTKKGSEKMPEAVTSSTSTVVDTTHNPKYKIYVNKQYDKNGNLVKFDSSYSYYYSSPNGGTMHIKDDSIYKQFKSYFSKNYPNSFNNPFNDMFYNDSLFQYDFFNNDYFMKRFEMNTKTMEEMSKQMDSIKNNFMERNYPNGHQKKDKANL